MCGCYGGSTDTYWFQTQNGYKDTGNGVAVSTENDINKIRFCFKKDVTFDNVTIYPMLLKGNYVGNLPSYEPYQSQTYPVDAEGKASVVPILPVTTLTATQGAIIRAEYAMDINKAFEKITNAIIALGGNV